MKRFFVVFTMVISSTLAYSQVNIELELGGSNFLGGSLNVERDFILNEHQTISAKLGLGGLFPGWPEVPTALYKGGLNYSYDRWGFGVDATVFTLSPFSTARYFNEELDLLVYPNVNYKWKFSQSYYLKFNIGAYFAFAKSYNIYGVEQSYFKNLEFQGDIIPGAGISIGTTF